MTTKRAPRQWYSIKALSDGLTAEINVYDEIGPSFCGEPAVNAASFGAELDALPATVKTIRVHVNCPGGDVFDALTIANRLKAQREEKGRTVEGVVEGVAASAATIITSACNPVRIADNALMMIHNPTVGGRGDAKAMRKMADLLDRTRDSIIATYRWISSKTIEELGALLDAETWMGATEAVANGFAHEIIGGVSVTASLRESSVARLGEIPEALRPQIDALVARSNEGARDDLQGGHRLHESLLMEALDRESLTAHAPDLVQALLDEGHAAGLSDAQSVHATPPVEQAIDRALVEAKAPALVRALLDEGRVEGINAERARIKALEANMLPGHGALLAAAKYGVEAADGKPAVEPMTPEAFCMALVAAERNHRAAHLMNAERDATDASEGIHPSAAPTGQSDEALLSHLVKVGGAAASTTPRRK